MGSVFERDERKAELLGCSLGYPIPFGFNFMSVKLKDIDSHC